MTPTEFGQTFNRHFLVYFPDTKAWVAKQSATTRRAWAESFAKIEVEDLRAAIAQVVNGEEQIPAYDRERTAAILKVLSLRMRYRREQREESRKLAQVGRQRPMGIDGIMRHIGAHDDYKELLSRIDAAIAREGVDKYSKRAAEINREIRDQFWAERDIDIQAIRSRFK